MIMRQQEIKELSIVPRKFTPCDAFILGKNNKQPFHNFDYRASRKLGLIHYDLCEPMHVPSTISDKYMSTFIDYYSRICWVYQLKEKSQVFETFKIFHLLIKNETQLNIGTL